MSEYGTADQTYLAVGGEAGLSKLVDTFYNIMASNSDYATIWKWHPKDKQVSRDKLKAFLSGWMGGPRRYQEIYGSISIPRSHAHLPVTHVERDQWLACMQEALVQEQYHSDLIAYLMRQFAVPAERIRLACSHDTD